VVQGRASSGKIKTTRDLAAYGMASSRRYPVVYRVVSLQHNASCRCRSCIFSLSSHQLVTILIRTIGLYVLVPSILSSQRHTRPPTPRPQHEEVSRCHHTFNEPVSTWDASAVSNPTPGGNKANENLYTGWSRQTYAGMRRAQTYGEDRWLVAKPDMISIIYRSFAFWDICARCVLMAFRPVRPLDCTADGPSAPRA
jgi:hypothetical protein